MLLTQAKYLKHGGLLCPSCRSNNITVDDDFESDTLEGWRDVYCHDCKTIWRDLYKLYGYEIVFEGIDDDTKARGNEAAQ